MHELIQHPATGLSPMKTIVAAVLVFFDFPAQSPADDRVIMNYLKLETVP